MTAPDAPEVAAAPAMPAFAETPRCGIVMPISTSDGYDESHWAEVRDILKDALFSAGFVTDLVSNADESGVIQKRIIQNLYENPLVVCDVSGKNPNVMFELGMRLAFDKPTVVVKDDATGYTFDTAPIEHLEYPRDLRHGKIEVFKRRLGEAAKATHDKAVSDPNYSTFLKQFGEFTAARIETKEVSKADFIIAQLNELSGLMAAFRKGQTTPPQALDYQQARLAAEVALQSVARKALEGKEFDGDGYQGRGGDDYYHYGAQLVLWDVLSAVTFSVTALLAPNRILALVNKVFSDWRRDEEKRQNSAERAAE